MPGGFPPGMEEYAASGAEIADLTNVSLRAMGRSIYETLVTETYPTWDTGVTQFPNDPYDNFCSAPPATRGTAAGSAWTR